MKKLLIVLLILGFAAPALGAGANFDLYGSFRTHLGYYSVDQEYIGGPGTDNTVGLFPKDDDSGTVLSFGGNSTLGANIYVTKSIVGKVEMGLREAGGGGETEEVYLRQALGVWNFGSGKLLAGKTYTPATFLGYSKMGGNIGSQYDGVMLGAGLPYIGRHPQLRLTFGDFEFALIEHNSDVQSYGADDVDFTLPRIEAAYTYKMDNITLRGIAGYQSYDIEGYQLNGVDPYVYEDWEKLGDESIDSYVLGLGGKFNFKPAYVNATISYLQNSNNYGNGDYGTVSMYNVYTGQSILAAVPKPDGFEDSTLLQGTLVAGYRVSPMVNLEAGLGYMSAEVDVAPNVTAEQTSMIYYAQAWMSMSENVHIIPEIGVVDRGDLKVTDEDDEKNGKMTYLDVSFRFEF
ncbi:MAG: hypothetical protein K9J85_06525 [Desulfobacteraceae bacterium]|nr:hypothetical protein [Desulfobacteraceae bacterium]